MSWFQIRQVPWEQISGATVGCPAMQEATLNLIGLNSRVNIKLMDSVNQNWKRWRMAGLSSINKVCFLTVGLKRKLWDLPKPPSLPTQAVKVPVSQLPWQITCALTDCSVFSSVLGVAFRREPLEKYMTWSWEFHKSFLLYPSCQHECKQRCP